MRSERNVTVPGVGGGAGAASAAAIGSALGALCVGSDYLLPYPAGLIGNIAGTWVLVAFAVGAATGRTTRRASAFGLITLVIATIVYYVLTSLLWPPSAVGRLLPGVIVWAAVSMVAGPAGAAAGWTWRSGQFLTRRSWWLRPLAVGSVSAVLAVEAALLAMRAFDGDTVLGAGVELAFAAAIPLAILRDGRARCTAYGLAVIAVIVAYPLMSLGLPIVFRLAGSGHL